MGRRAVAVRAGAWRFSPATRMKAMATRLSRSDARLRALLGFGALCAILVGVVALSAQADAAKTKRLGRTEHTPAPERGVVEGRVTGFQKVADGKRNLFKAKEDGRIVAWAVDLSRPSDADQDFFRSIFFAGDRDQPYARIGVLRHRTGAKFRLMRQSPRVRLKSAMGRRQVITLNHPLRINAGNVLALTIPTWLPAFAQVGPASDNQWRGSRSPDNCAPDANTFRSKKRFAQRSSPQKKVGSTRRYGCKYRGGRLLYWAYYVPGA